MKQLSILILSLLLLSACSEEAENGLQSEILENKEIETTDKKEFSIKAKFVKFELGDAEHYSFEKESGEIVVFDGCEITNYDFALVLDESKANEDNQGGGSNTKLQGKWFTLSYFNREQPMYIDGPVGTARIISNAVLNED